MYRLYESENTDVEVTDQSVSSTLVPVDGSTTRYTLSNPPTAGCMFVNMPISEALGSAGDVSAVRSDSKTMKADNVWISNDEGVLPVSDDAFAHLTESQRAILNVRKANSRFPPLWEPPGFR